MAMIGCKEMMGDAAFGEVGVGKKVPHPLAKASFEVVRSSIAPNVDAVEVINQLLALEEEKPHMQDEVIVILVGFRAVAEEVDVLAHAFAVAHVLQHDHANLHDGMIGLVTNFGSQVD
jgi:hypothetical protein